MTPGDTLISVWRQSLTEGRREVDVEDKHYPVGLFHAKKLRNVEFSYGELSIIGIEQNPATNSRWASLARQGNRIMQFRCQGRYVANVCEGKLLRHPAWGGMELPE